MPRSEAAKVIRHENESKVFAASKALVHADQAERREHSEGGPAVAGEEQVEELLKESCGVVTTSLRSICLNPRVRG